MSSTLPNAMPTRRSTWPPALGATSSSRSPSTASPSPRLNVKTTCWRLGCSARQTQPASTWASCASRFSTRATTPAVAALRDALGENDFDAAWAEGAALSIEEATAYALTGSRRTQARDQRLGFADPRRAGRGEARQ